MGGGYSDIVIYLGLVQFLLKIIWGFQKNEYFWGMKILWILFGGSSQNWTIFGSLLCILGSFLRPVYRMGIFLSFFSFFFFFLGGGGGAAKIPHIFWGMPGIPSIIFLVNSRCWVQAYVARQFESTPLALAYMYHEDKSN